MEDDVDARGLSVSGIPPPLPLDSNGWNDSKDASSSDLLTSGKRELEERWKLLPTADRNLGMDLPFAEAVPAGAAVVDVVRSAVVLATGRHDCLGCLVGDVNSCHGSGSRPNKSRKLSALCTPRRRLTVVETCGCTTGERPGGPGAC